MEEHQRFTRNYYDTKAPALVHKYRRLMTEYSRPEFGQFMRALPVRSDNGTAYRRENDGTLTPETKRFTRQFILDIGCGGGDHAAYFTSQGLTVECIDSSAEMVGIAREKGLDAAIMDIEDLKFNPNQFHGIWAVTSLPHVPKARMPPVVDKLAEICKPNGIVFACIKEGKNEGYIYDRDDRNTPRYFAFYNDGEFRDLFGKKFSVIGYERQQFGESVFLKYFFKNRKKE